MAEEVREQAEAVREETATSAGLSEDEMRQRVVELAFDNDPAKLDRFLEVLREAIPPSTGAVLRGSSVTGKRWSDGAPFDADGPGTSDLDLTLVGTDILGYYILDGFFVPGVHTKPLSEKDPDIAPELIPLREKLVAMVNRPVNIQATRDVVMYLRENFFGQPYLTLIPKTDEGR